MKEPLPLVLVASARPAGDTAQLVAHVFAPGTCTVADLLAQPLYPYTYSGQYPPDDAFPALVQLLLHHQVLVLATPVYWYAMSGLLKTFLDRLTDLVTIAKPLGRQLRGKKLLVLASGADAALPAGFLEPFQRTAAYFGLHFAGHLYQSVKAAATPADWPQQVRAFRRAAAPIPHLP